MQIRSHRLCAYAGRISVFAEPSAETRAAGMKGGAWVYATHDLADTQSVLDSMQKSLASGAIHSTTIAQLHWNVTGNSLTALAYCPWLCTNRQDRTLKYRQVQPVQKPQRKPKRLMLA